MLTGREGSKSVVGVALLKHTAVLDPGIRIRVEVLCRNLNNTTTTTHVALCAN